MAAPTHAPGMSRSTSFHHISPSMHTLSHYGSAAADIVQSSSTPHLAHLRQSSSVASHHAHDEHHSHFPTSASGYDVYEEIGVGAFASVYHAAVKETGEQVAIKVIDLDQFNTNWEEIRKEVLIMNLVHHPNVVRILTSFVEEQDLWLIMPLLEGGSCAHIMKTICPTGMKDEALLATILKEVLHGLLYFHKDGKLHRDLKAGNVLISAEGDVQLADFGVAGSLMDNGDRQKVRRTFTGTPCWMAPEVMEHSSSGYDEKADIWSFGITALELAYGRAPYAKFPPMKVMVLTLQEEPPTSEIYKDHSYEFSRHFHTMIEKCLRKTPDKRPNVKKLLEHKFFKQAKDKQYIIDKIIKKMPVKRISANPKLLNLCELRHPTLHGKDAGGDPEAEKARPVSVGSWVFDKDEFDQLKISAMEEKEAAGPDGARMASVAASYADEDTPKSAANRKPGASGTPSSRALAVPSTIPSARTPMSSAEEEDSEEHSDDEHRPKMDFSDPSGGDGLSLLAAASAHPQAPANVSVTLPAAAAAAAAAGATSPGEHQEGRFMVSDDAEDAGDEQPHFVHEGQPVYPQGEVYPSHDNYYSGAGGAESQAFPAFHNEAYVDDDDASFPEDHRAHDQHGEKKVGRFAVTDDGDE